jgi:hypothetical protein
VFLFSSVSNLRRFCDDRSGGVAIIFGLMFIVMISIVGAAIDMGRAMTEQTQLQASLDAAVLDTAAKSRRIGSNVAVDGKHSFDHSWKKRHGAQQPSAAFTRHEGGVFKGKATTTVPTIVSQLFGVNEIQISAESEVKSKSQTAEIALVVDNTWSMNGTKIETLKNSARLLVDTVFEGVEQPGALKVSIVPFSQYVNVGLSNRNQPWLSVENDSSTTSENCNWHQPTRCVRTRTENYTQWIDGIPYARTRTVCAETVNDGPRVWRCTTNTNHRRWSGCVGSRNVPLNTQDTSFTGATTIPGLMNVT